MDGIDFRAGLFGQLRPAAGDSGPADVRHPFVRQRGSARSRIATRTTRPQTLFWQWAPDADPAGGDDRG